jgi:hypothetical protein
MQWVQGALTQSIMWTYREADHSPPPGVQVKNCEAICPLSQMYSRRGAYLSTGTTLHCSYCAFEYNETVHLVWQLSSRTRV